MRPRVVGPGSAHGFTVIEMVVSLSIMLGITGAIFALVNPSQGAYRVQPEVAALQHRLRVAVDMLQGHLLMAGGGMYAGPAGGALGQFIAPVLPYRAGRTDPDPDRGLFFRPDAMTVLYVPSTAAQTTLKDPLTTPTASVRVAAGAEQPGCPAGDPLCGFATGQTVLVFDDTGASNTFRVTGTTRQAVQLEGRGRVLSKAYPVGTFITQVETHTYHLDTTEDRLMHYDGWDTDDALIDDVVGVRFRYFGDPDPPTSPRPAIGAESCLFRRNGTPRLAQLTPTHGGLVELTARHLANGPWCGGANRFDADLYRVRTVKVELRLQAAALDLRGADPRLFRRPGLAVSGGRMVPDYEMSFDVSPRNLNLSR